MRPKLPILLLLLLSAAAVANARVPLLVSTSGSHDSLLVLRGRVMCDGRPVPYASLQLQGTSLGVSCNDAGEYLFKVHQTQVNDTVLVRSLGCVSLKTTVARLLKNGDIRLKVHIVELNPVAVSDFRSARHLLLAVVSHIERNYQQKTAWSTFFYRDWRSVDGELYLFDEAVMNVCRCPYSQYADKRAYLLDPSRREMESNIKSLLRHRLVVCDRRLLESKIVKSRGCDQMLVYSDNEDFFDPVATPQASYALAGRMLKEHTFEPIKTFSDDGEIYYLVRSVGPCRNSRERVRYEYTIRRSDLALVRLVSSQQPLRTHAPREVWVNWYYNSMVVEADSSVWTYDVRDGRYTLTRYYHTKSFRLESRGRGRDDMVQHWRQCLDWVLTDFSLTQVDTSENQVSVSPQPLPSAFGGSDFDSGFWGHYNTVPIDLLPLQLLKEKFHLL